MFARAFESFIEDELQARGRECSYLVSGTKTAYATGKMTYLTPEGESAQVYPQGKERERINKAMRNLIEVVKKEGRLKKALEKLNLNARDLLLKALIA